MRFKTWQSVPLFFFFLSLSVFESEVAPSVKQLFVQCQQKKKSLKK